MGGVGVFAVFGEEGGEAVAEVFEGEVEALVEADGFGEGLGVVGEEGGHFGAGFEVALGVGAEEGAGLVEGGVVAQAGEDVGDEFVLLGGVEGGVGDEEGEMVAVGEFAEGVV